MKSWSCINCALQCLNWLFRVIYTSPCGVEWSNLLISSKEQLQHITGRGVRGVQLSLDHLLLKEPTLKMKYIMVYFTNKQHAFKQNRFKSILSIWWFSSWSYLYLSGMHKVVTSFENSFTLKSLICRATNLSTLNFTSAFSLGVKVPVSREHNFF